MHRRVFVKAMPRHYSKQRIPPLLTGRTIIDVRAMAAKSLATASLFPKWPQPMIESRGDYRAESHLESIIGGPLYANQPTLPRLPVPSVEDTIQSLLPTALPLAESDRERDSLIEACRAFPSQSVQLQKRLEDRMNSDMKDSSWLQLWWNTLGYLQVRDSVVVNVSYFFHFSDDGTLPAPNRAGNKSPAVMRGASILVAAAEFRKMVCTGALPCEAIGKNKATPLCSVAYKYMFNACRVPRRTEDTYRIYDPSLHTHCIVACKGHFFSLDFVNGETGDPLSLEVIEERLENCIKSASKIEGSAKKLGWLTSSDRDSWADARVELIRVGGVKMEKALENLESGALMLCLDEEEPISRKQCGELFWTGGLSSGFNRWFDKSIQILVTKNGKAGLMGEHSMMDGMPMVAFANHVTKASYRVAQARALSGSVYFDKGVQPIFQDCFLPGAPGDANVDQMITKAKADFSKLVMCHQLHVQSFQGYGSNYIKSVGYSPDAYVQIALQLATYRLWTKQAGTYEATQMRPFLHGRTETTRSVSPASHAFVKRMGLRPQHDETDESVRKEKLALLRVAVESHIKYIGKAAKGAGVDRHLLGLLLLLDEGEIAPDLYNDPLYVRAKRWRVSTSHLTHPKLDNWGFGEVVSDGVGVAYSINPDSCIFNITARREHDWTDRLSHLLEEALLEMQLLNDMSRPIASKL